MSVKLQSCVLLLPLFLTLGCSNEAPAPQRAAQDNFSGRPYIAAMSQTLASAPQFTVKVTTDKDQIVDSGVVAGPTTRIIKLQRPNRLAIQVTHPKGTRQIWYDGSRIVSLDSDRKAYASMPATGSVGNMFASLRKTNHYIRPLAALCDSDPASALCANASSVVLVGQKNLAGRTCNVVRIERPDATIDLWIPDNKAPFLLQAVVRETASPGQQRVCRFEDWNTAAPIKAADFELRLPKGAYQVEMIDMTGLP